MYDRVTFFIDRLIEKNDFLMIHTSVEDDDMCQGRILRPAAGEGSRFRDQGLGFHGKCETMKHHIRF